MPAKPVGARPGTVCRAENRCALDKLIDRIGILRHVPRDAEICGSQEPATHFYKLRKGLVRSFKVGIEGRRHVDAFYVPGDVFGLETSERHLFSAEAVIDSEIVTVGSAAVTALAGRRSDIAQDLWRLTGGELRRTRHHLLLLNKTAPERLASFLLEMDERLDLENGELRLRMSRRDVADYLGLSIETISRTIGQLEAQSAIALINCRRIVIRNRSSLAKMTA
jgi:CRP/FNR family nitrogen fixation transcriptional regulator